MSHHANLSVDHWAEFSLEQQVIMIANELNRASKMVDPGDDERRRNCYGRALALTDLTVLCDLRPEFRFDLMRWRDVLMGLYVSNEADPRLLGEALRFLLRLTPETAKQIPLLAAARS